MASPKSKVKVSVLYGARDLRNEIHDIDHPKANELQVAVKATGLCGSDLHYYTHGRNGDIILREPMSLGHESAGIVVVVGSEVSGFRVGDKVALEVGLPCGRCHRCEEGRYNICKGMKFGSSARRFPHSQGTLQERINHPAAWCHLLPANISLALGALLEPLSVAIHANRRANLPSHSTALVFGAGTVGLLTAAMAKISGSTVIIADIDIGRVDFALSNGFADGGFVVDKKRGETIEQRLEYAKKTASLAGSIERPSGESIGEFDAVFECSGAEACLQAAIYATRPGGKVVMIGMGTPVQTLPVSEAALREVDLIGSFRYANTYTEGIKILGELGSGRPDFPKLVTHKFHGFDELEEAFEMASRTADCDGRPVLKVIVEVLKAEHDKTQSVLHV